MSKNRNGDEALPRSIDYKRWVRKSIEDLPRSEVRRRNARERIKEAREHREDPVRIFEARERALRLFAQEAEDDGSWDRYTDYRKHCEDWAWNTLGCSWDSAVASYFRDDAA